jgi:putative colanic acid biosynthesis acetyltransferase WcaF
MERQLKLFSSEGPRPSFLRLGCWVLVQNVIFKSIFCPNGMRALLLRIFGAQLGKRVIIRRGVRVHFPWNLSIGDDCWIGEEVWIINHEKVVIEQDVCISQRAVICSGGHDYRSASLNFAHKPIHIKAGAWVCLDAKVLPGVNIGTCSVISAGEIARSQVPDYSILISGELREIEPPR